MFTSIPAERFNCTTLEYRQQFLFNRVKRSLGGNQQLIDTINAGADLVLTEAAGKEATTQSRDEYLQKLCKAIAQQHDYLGYDLIRTLANGVELLTIMTHDMSDLANAIAVAAIFNKRKLFRSLLVQLPQDPGYATAKSPLYGRPVDIAASRGHHGIIMEVVNYLKTHPSCTVGVFAVGSLISSLIRGAIKEKHPKSLEALLRLAVLYGDEYGLQDSCYVNWLSYAASRGYGNAVHIILDAKGFGRMDGTLPHIRMLATLCGMRDTSIITKLVNRFPSLLKEAWTDYEDVLPLPEETLDNPDIAVCLLHVAIAFGTRDILKTLLDAGADADGLTHDGWTMPLHYAIHMQNIPAVKILLEYGATLHSDTVWYHDTLKIAKRTGNKSLYDLVCTGWIAALKTKVEGPIDRPLKRSRRV
jgi:hypothetical protein